ncbi:MAG: transposase, partial [Bifidobacteriaceae bacterium]|nr:transposase [Bifidobacteriaceae bacterium]
QPLFTESGEYNHFLKAAKDVSRLADVAVLAYVLMPNHVHFLLEGDLSAVAAFFHRLNTRYVVWFNRRHGRVGHLFQGRFKSKPVEDDAYMITVVVYVALNPVKAGLSRTAVGYPWGSASPQAAWLGLVNRERLAELVNLDAVADRLQQAELGLPDLPDPFAPEGSAFPDAARSGQGG